MKKSFLLLLATVTFFQVKLIADTSPFQALRYLGSARSTALAGCFVSIPDDPAAVFYNPASIYTTTNKNFSTTFFKHVLDINSGQVVYILPEKQAWAGDGKIATAISYTNFGSFDYADESGRQGTFGANDVSLAAVYSNELDSNFYYGIAAKLLFINLDTKSSLAFAFDAGLLYSMPEKRTDIGLSILHAGAQFMSLNGTRESVPLDVRLGVSHRLRGLPLLANFSFHHLADKSDKFYNKFLSFSLGGEFSFGKYVKVRLGYDNQIRRLTTPSDNKKLSGFTGGVGIATETFSLDYGIAQMGTTALLHRFTVGFEL